MGCDVKEKKPFATHSEKSFLKNMRNNKGAVCAIVFGAPPTASPTTIIIPKLKKQGLGVAPFLQ